MYLTTDKFVLFMGQLISSDIPNVIPAVWRMPIRGMNWLSGDCLN
jgi:hypothetical protein